VSEQQDGGERRRLDRAPGERYRAASRGPAPERATSDRRRARATVALLVVADAGAAVFFLLGLLDLGVGLLAIAAFLGWIIGVTMIWWGRDTLASGRRRIALAASAGAWAIALAIVVDWGYALLQGGVLGPLDYVAQRYGPLGPLSVIIAAMVAAWRAH
jgi:hypothetical protein